MTQSIRLRNQVHDGLTAMLDPSGGPLSTIPGAVLAFLNDDFIDSIAVEYRALSPDAPAQGRAAIITAGPPGAGKSTALSALLADHRRIDPDEVKDILLLRLRDAGLLADRHQYVLPDGGCVQPAELAWWVHRASTDVADLVRQVSLAQGENFAMEGTLSWEPLAGEYSGELLNYDYKSLVVLDVEVPLVTAVEQARARWWGGRTSGLGLGGRFVSDAALSGYYPDTDRVSVCATQARALFGDAEDSGIATTLALESRTGSGATSAAVLTPSGGVNSWRGLVLGAVCVRCGARLSAETSILRGLSDDCARHHS